MRIFKTKGFQQWVAKEGLSDQSLRSAVLEMNKGLVDANLGGNVFKKRIAMQGRGKRAGARTLVAFRQEEKIFFIYGFAKNQKSNVSRNELDTLKKLASHLLSNSDAVLKTMVFDNELIEVEFDERLNT
jgi:hypothetical protein